MFLLLLTLGLAIMAAFIWWAVKEKPWTTYAKWTTFR
jgi:hypothetical protein